MLRLRVLTAAIGVPLILFLFLGGDLQWRKFFLAGCAVYSLWEMLGLTTRAAITAGVEPANINQGRSVRLFVFVTISAVVLQLVASDADVGVAIPALIAVAFIAPLFYLSVKLEPSQLYPMASGVMIAVVWAVTPWFFLLDLLVEREHFSGWLLFLLAVVWMGDTGGYFGGRFFGKNKLAPHISPKKTVEGAVVGLVASGIGGCGMAQIVEITDLSVPFIVLLSAILGAVGQMGDLVESLVKRYVGVKDSGTLLPGHGGFLDRVDGVLFAAPVLWVALKIY